MTNATEAATTGQEKYFLLEKKVKNTTSTESISE